MSLTVDNLQALIDNQLKFVEVASFCVKRACDELVVHRGLQKKASGLSTEVLDLMIKTGAVREDQRATAAAMLGSHAETLMLLRNAVQTMHERSEKRAGALGEASDDPAQQKEAFDSVNSPFVGRKTSQKKASDLAILAVLDAPSR